MIYIFRKEGQDAAFVKQEETCFSKEVLENKLLKMGHTTAEMKD